MLISTYCINGLAVGTESNGVGTVTVHDFGCTVCVMLSFCASALIPAISNNFGNPDTIFANNEMSLQDIEIYGFDYDYTLAFYSKHLHTLIFNVARDILIQQHRVSTV